MLGMERMGGRCWRNLIHMQRGCRAMMSTASAAASSSSQVPPLPYMKIKPEHLANQSINATPPAGSPKNLIDHYAHFNPSPMSIKQFLEFGKSLTTNGKELCERASCDYLRKELPVRLANIIKEIHLLPESLLSRPSTQIVQGWYEKSFAELVRYEQVDLSDPSVVRNFTKDLTVIRNRHNLVVETMAQGVVELNKGSGDELPVVDSVTRMSIQYFLDRFYMMRISIRMLISQHTILFGGESPFSTRHVGTIDPECDVQGVVEEAFESARSLCEQYYEKSPDLRINCVNVVDKDEPLKIVYVPSHLYHISFELFKNAMRASCELSDCPTIPPIDVVIVKTAEDVAIKLSDRGGGIPQRNMARLFEYMFSTAPTPMGEDAGGSGLNAVPMAGYGYGLPLSRLYARYFHGDLQVYSVHGYGTDAVIYLKTLSENANELLPIFNKSVMKQYRASRTHGWTSTSKFSQLVEWG